MAVFTITAFQGQAISQIVDLNPTTAFYGTESLIATVSTGGTDTALLTIAPSWVLNQTAGQYQLVIVSLTDTQTTALAPGYYALSIGLTDSSGQLAWGLLEVVSSAGNVPVQDFLATPAEAIGLLPSVMVTSSVIGSLPRLLSAATQEIRRWCMNRDFTRKTYVDVFPVALSGYIRLAQVPVNQVLRVQSQLDPALTITNNTAQFSQAMFTFTGDVASGQTITGITLKRTTNGVPNTTTITYSANETISTLATAITATGNGWSAAAETTYGTWPVTELYGGMAAIGTGQFTSGETVFRVFSQDVSNAQFHPDDGQNTGMLWVGETSRGVGPTWGPDPIDYDYGAFGSPNMVKVTYDAGFATIPSTVIFACIELVKAMLHRLQINPYLQSQRAGDYAYQLATQCIHALPEYVLEELAQYRLHNA